MKKLLSTRHNLKNLDLIILIARVSIAALMLSHGLPKLAMLLTEGPVQFPGMLGMNPELSLGLAVFSEVFCSFFILIGFGTRYATIPLIVTMLVIVLFVHAADPFVKQELALHYLLVYGLLFLIGSGKYSIDHILQNKKLNTSYSQTKFEDPIVGIYN